MQLPTDIIPPMATWQEYTYVCDFDTCDTLIKVTVNDKFGWGPVKDIDCPACGRMPHLLSVEDATIYPKEKQGEKMETLALNEASYNPHELVTYKVIENGETSYENVKVTDLEFAIHTQKERIANLERLLNNYSNQLSSITDLMTEDEFYADHITKEDVLDSLTQCLDYQPVKEISWTATLRVEGRAELPLAEDVSDFINSIEFSTDAWNGEVIVEDTQVLDIEEN